MDGVSIIENRVILHVSKGRFKRCFSNEKKSHYKYWIKSRSETCKLNHVMPYTKHRHFNGIYFTFVLPLFQVQGNNCFCTFLLIHTLCVGVLIYSVQSLCFFVLLPASENRTQIVFIMFECWYNLLWISIY